MIGLDTNVVLRALTDDDPVQSPIARRLFESLSDTNPGYINLVVLAETSWTLARRHKYTRRQIIEIVDRLLESTSFVVANRVAVERALTLAEADDLDYPDALLSELNKSAGCTTTITFDHAAARSSAFSLAQ